MAEQLASGRWSAKRHDSSGVTVRIFPEDKQKEAEEWENSGA